jgi:hypothetical protein
MYLLVKMLIKRQTLLSECDYMLKIRPAVKNEIAGGLESISLDTQG